MERRKIILSRLKRRFLKRLWLARLALAVLGILVLITLGLGLNFLFQKTGLSVYTSFARDFLFFPKDKVVSTEGRVNVLILGKGGAGHDAPELTDTLIFTSVSLEKPKISLVSLPRDIWIGALRAKLNSAYYWGNQKQPGGGLVLAKSTTEEIVGEPVHYGLVIDFSGFKRVVDAVGGIELEVENAFTDERYPIVGRENDDCGGDPEFQCRYETLHFDQGRKMMDGETALKFVRSRNAEGDEGTDLDRAARQQKVIAALKNKVLSKDVLLNPKKLKALKEATAASVETDLKGSELAVVARAFFNARNNLVSHALPEDLLVVPPSLPQYDYLYIFVPAKGEWSEVHAWIESVLP
jgi:LCP family protein required for cell wall assembly